VLTIAGVENPEFDGFPYYMAKRAAEDIVLNGAVPATIVKSTQFHEFATNPAAVVFKDHEVVVEAALGQTRTPRTITGPHAIRLPLLTSQLLAVQGDRRRVRAVSPALSALAVGALLAPDHAAVLGPDVDTWLDTMALNETGSSRAAEGSTGQATTPSTPDLTNL